MARHLTLNFNIQPAFALDGLRRAEHSMFNAQRSTGSL